MRALFAASLALASFVPVDASACSCVQVSPEQALAEHDAVFEGRVVEVEAPDDPSGRVRVTMAVVQQWKGADTERVIVTTAAQSSACGVSFVPDTSWLVYADAEGDALTTGLCSRTRRIEEAEEDLAALGAGVVPVDITAEDEVEEPSEEPPARGGCASCAVGAGASTRGMLSVLAALALVAIRRRHA